MTLKKSARRADDSPLLGPGDAVGAAAVTVAFTVPYFGEYQRIAVQHDQVDFTETCLVVSLPRLETSLVQKGFGNLFPVTAALTRCGHPLLLGRIPQRYRTAPAEFSPGGFALKRILVGCSVET